VCAFRERRRKACVTNPKVNFGGRPGPTPLGCGAFLLRGLLIVIGVNIGWGVLTELGRDYHLFWIISRPHYEIAFTIQTPAGVQTATSVVEPVYFIDPGWDDVSIWSLVWTEGFGPPFGHNLNGGAVAMRLPDGKVVCMLRERQLEKNHSIFDVADRLLTRDKRIRFWSWNGIDPTIDANTAMQISGSAEIPPDLTPAMVVFLNGADMNSVHVFDPANPGQWLGPGARFLGARISVTKAPVSSDVHAFLPWLHDYPPKGPGPITPLRIRTHDSTLFGLDWYYFIYSSRI